MPTEIRVRGLKELETRLIALGAKAGTKAMKSAMYHGYKPTFDSAKAKVPTGQSRQRKFTPSGALRLALTRGFTSAPSASLDRGSLFRVSIYPKVKHRVAIALHNLHYRRQKHPKRGIYYGHMVEFGTKRSRKHAFLLPALESTAREIVRRFSRQLGKSIERIAKKGR